MYLRITVVVGMISCTFGFVMPTYFEMFALRATLFSTFNDDQKEERRIIMKNDTLMAATVATLGDAWQSL